MVRVAREKMAIWLTPDEESQKKNDLSETKLIK